jgi:hypothetical protein
MQREQDGDQDEHAGDSYPHSYGRAPSSNEFGFGRGSAARRSCLWSFQHACQGPGKTRERWALYKRRVASGPVALPPENEPGEAQRCLLLRRQPKLWRCCGLLHAHKLDTTADEAAAH